jgi:hypothetical protein
VLVSLPITYVSSFLERRREAEFRKQLSVSNRCIEWHRLGSRLASDGGTVLIQTRGNKLAPRLWWTPEDVLTLAPYPPPESLFFLEPPHEFIDWCNKRYLDERHGTAILCLPPCHLLLTSDFGTKLRSEFPKVSAVHVPEYLEAAYGYSADNEDLRNDASNDSG